jgi:hypothetical protein
MVGTVPVRHDLHPRSVVAPSYRDRTAYGPWCGAPGERKTARPLCGSVRAVGSARDASSGRCSDGSRLGRFATRYRLRACTPYQLLPARVRIHSLRAAKGKRPARQHNGQWRFRHRWRYRGRGSQWLPAFTTHLCAGDLAECSKGGSVFRGLRCKSKGSDELLDEMVGKSYTSCRICLVR